MATTCHLNSPSSLPNCDGTNIRTITLSPIKLSRSLTEALNLVSLLFNRLSKTSLSPQHSWSSQLFLYFRFWQLLFVTYTLVVKMVLNTWYLCISMAYKVIECIVFTQNTQSWKSLFSLYKTSQITKNSPKKRSLSRDFIIFLNRYIWYIFYGMWRILMSSRFRICMGAEIGLIATEFTWGLTNCLAVQPLSEEGRALLSAYLATWVKAWTCTSTDLLQLELLSMPYYPTATRPCPSLPRDVSPRAAGPRF